MRNKDRAVLYTLFIGFLMLSGGCAAQFVNINEVQHAQNYNDIVKLLAGLDCHVAEESKECFYSRTTVNIFTLKRRVQMFHFILDNNEIITDKKLDELFMQFYIIPQAELPNYVTEFR